MLPICHDLRFVSTCSFLPRFPRESNGCVKDLLNWNNTFPMHVCQSLEHLQISLWSWITMHSPDWGKMTVSQEANMSHHLKTSHATKHSTWQFSSFESLPKKKHPISIISSRNATSESRIHHVTDLGLELDPQAPETISLLLDQFKGPQTGLLMLHLGRNVKQKLDLFHQQNSQMLSNFDPSWKKKILKKRSVWQFQELTCKEKQGNDRWWYLIKQLSWICINLHIQQEKEAVRNHAAATGTCSWSFSCSSLRSAGT